MSPIMTMCTNAVRSSVAPPRHSGRRRASMLALSLSVGCAALTTVAEPLLAQQRMTTRSEQQSRGAGSRAGWFSLIGAASGATMAMGYYAMSQRGDRAGGCQPFNCAMPFLVVTGALSGLFISRELDAQRRAEAPRTGTSYTFGFAEAEAMAAPNSIDVRDSLIAVVSDSGAQLFSAKAQPKALRRRAAGLSSLRQVVILPTSQSLLLGTSTALWEASLSAGPASRIADGPVDALAASGDAVMSASGKRVRLRRGIGAEQRVDSMTMSSAVYALSYDETSRQWWVALDSSIVPLEASDAGLRIGSALPVPATARAIAGNATWIAAALGDGGVMAWRRDAMTAGPIVPVHIMQEPRFAYDLAFLDDQLFVAGGVDGLFRLSLAPVPRVLGSSRQFPFATTVRASGGVVWVGDRARRSIVRVTPQP